MPASGLVTILQQQFNAALQTYGQSVSRIRPAYQGASGTVAETTVNIQVFVNSEEIRHILSVHEVGNQNIGDPVPYNLYSAGSADIKDTDVVEFNGFRWTVTEVDTLAVSGTNLYKKIRVIKERNV